MFNLIRIGNDIFPASRIETVTIGNQSVSIKLTGTPEIKYTDMALAGMALDGLASVALPPTTVINLQICDSTLLIPIIPINDLVWANLDADCAGTRGIEVRVQTDPPGITRQFTTEEIAGQLYDILNLLAPGEVLAGEARG